MKKLRRQPLPHGRGSVTDAGGGAMLETVLWVPFLVLLLVGMVELGRVVYTYHSLQKTLYTLARYVGTRQGVNFCDDADAVVTAAKNYALTGSTEETAESLLQGLEADMIRIRIERYNADSGQLEECECSETGCDAAAGGRAPEYLVVSIPDGYPVQLNIPSLLLDPIPLKPQVRIPYGGT